MCYSEDSEEAMDDVLSRARDDWDSNDLEHQWAIIGGEALLSAESFSQICSDQSRNGITHWQLELLVKLNENNLSIISHYCRFERLDWWCIVLIISRCILQQVNYMFFIDWAPAALGVPSPLAKPESFWVRDSDAPFEAVFKSARIFNLRAFICFLKAFNLFFSNVNGLFQFSRILGGRKWTLLWVCDTTEVTSI